MPRQRRAISQGSGVTEHSIGIGRFDGAKTYVECTKLIRQLYGVSRSNQGGVIRLLKLRIPKAFDRPLLLELLE